MRASRRSRPWVSRLIGLLACLVIVLGGSVTVSSARPHRLAAGPVRLPPVNGRFDYQIGGAYPPARSVRIVDRDRSDRPAAGRYSICYVNAFQTQPGELAFWRHRHPDALLRRHGALVRDPGWPDEVLLDTRTAARRAVIAGVVEGWLRGCAAHGFAAVEPDNLDSWTRSHQLLTAADNIALARTLAAAAHRAGLAIAQKNTAELGRTGASIGFDFAIAEECEVYHECSAYTKVYGRHVIEVEYTDNGRAAYKRACAARGRQISIILRDRDVVARGRSAYRYSAC